MSAHDNTETFEIDAADGTIINLNGDVSFGYKVTRA
jgi:hypothetical protein